MKLTIRTLKRLIKEAVREAVSKGLSDEVCEVCEAEAQFGIDDHSFCGTHVKEYLESSQESYTSEEVFDIGNGSNADARSFESFVGTLIDSGLLDGDSGEEEELNDDSGKGEYWDEADTIFIKKGAQEYDIGQMLRQENPGKWRNVQTTNGAYFKALGDKALEVCAELGITELTDIAFDEKFIPVAEFFNGDVSDKL